MIRPVIASGLVLARALGEQRSREFSQPAVVDNRPGGNSVIAIDLLAKSPPSARPEGC